MAANQEVAITVKGLHKSFKNVEVLKGVDLVVPRGSIYALLGSNGAGKTTSIHIMTTLLRADAGSVNVAGFDVARDSERVRERISLTGQFAAVDGILTGRENLELIAKLRHEIDPKDRAAELLARFGLTDAADRRVNTYSGGMARRLDIAMSLLGDPEVVFLDEPTTGLDPQSRILMWKTIRSLNDQGLTVFLTTQYLDEADQLADRIAILNEGKIVVEGTSDELKKQIPFGHIELRFADDDNMQAAASLLTGYETTVVPEDRLVTVVTDGSIEKLTTMLDMLASSHIQVLQFEQKMPTLEDVFLKTIETKEVAA